MKKVLLSFCLGVFLLLLIPTSYATNARGNNHRKFTITSSLVAGNRISGQGSGALAYVYVALDRNTGQVVSLYVLGIDRTNYPVINHNANSSNIWYNGSAIVSNNLIVNVSIPGQGERQLVFTGLYNYMPI